MKKLTLTLSIVGIITIGINSTNAQSCNFVSEPNGFCT